MKKLVLILLVAILAMQALAEDVTPCNGDVNGSGVVDVSDLGDMIFYLSAHPCDITGWPGSCFPPDGGYGYCDYKVYSTDPDYNAVFDMNDNGIIDVGDLGDLIYLLYISSVDLDGWPGSCVNYGYCDYKYVCGDPLPW